MGNRSNRARNRGQYIRLRLLRRIGTYRQARRTSVRNRSMLRAFPVMPYQAWWPRSTESSHTGCLRTGACIRRRMARRSSLSFAIFADSDGIVCIPPVRGEPSAGERILELLAVAFGDAWSDRVLTRLLTEAGSPTLNDWLRNRFFEQHCARFHHRPFV